MKRRIHPNHERYKDFLSELGIKEAGIHGEQALDYYINLFPEQDPPFRIFHDLRLPYRDTFFQIDTLILFSNFYLILEVKNYRGIIQIDPKNHQVIQEIEDSPLKSLPDPILQVNNQSLKMDSWINKNKFPALPAEKLVILTNSKAIIRVISYPSLVEKHVIRPAVLLGKLEPLLNRYFKPCFDKKALNKISKLLLKAHTPLITSPIKQYNISPKDIIPGVLCEKCQSASVMNRVYGKWRCPSCFHISADAHIAALEDYALLISPIITMNQLKTFLKMENDQTIRKLMNNTKVDIKGDNKGRYYYLKF
jgi:hypothetical protein